MALQHAQPGTAGSDPLTFELAVSSAQLQGGRKRQEDACLTLYGANGRLLTLVADGLGGHARGDEASRCAVNVIAESFRQHSIKETDKDVIHEWLLRADHEIRSAVALPTIREPATTVIGAVFDPAKRQALCFSVGDSLLFHYREGHEELVFEPDGRDNKVEHAVGLGLTSTCAVQYHTLSLQAQDRLLFCSDGLLTLGPDERRACLDTSTARDSAENLVVRIMNVHKTLQDNITAVVVDVLDQAVSAP